MKYLVLFFFVWLTLNAGAQEKKNWTILHYAAGSNSSEIDLLSDVQKMKRGKVSNDYNLLCLIDRIEGFSQDSTTLDGNFNDTRLYQIEHNAYKRLEGEESFPSLKLDSSFEANMGDANTLKLFIQYAKKYYPANHYMLVMRSHGNGFAMCADAESGKNDKIYSAELSNILSAHESVDILGLDVCSMAGLENLYQWRPNTKAFSADYIIASAPLSGAWAYDFILERIGDKAIDSSHIDSSYFLGGLEKNLNPKTMTPLELSQLVMEEIYDHQRWSSWGLFANSFITDVKMEIDMASKLLALEDKSLILSTIKSSLAYYHNTTNNIDIAQLSFPYVDAYHFWTQISQNQKYKESTRAQAKQVCNSIDQLVIYSYHGKGYFPDPLNFSKGKSGVYQIIPQGERIFSQSKQPFWAHCSWFHPYDQSSQTNSYGLYSWCIDGAVQANNQVDNFYELLDFLFDETNNVSGGLNKYQW